MAGKRPEEGALPLEADTHLLIGSPVDALFLDRKPGLKVTVGSLEGVEAVAPPESFPDEGVGPFHLALDPCRVCRGDLGLEPVVYCQTHQARVEVLSSCWLADICVPHPVIENLTGNPAEELEGPDMAIEKGHQIAAPDQFRIDPSRVSQDHGKQVVFLRRPVGKVYLEVPEVHLGLVAGLGLNAQVGNPGAFLLHGADRALDHVVTPGIPQGNQPVVDPGRLVAGILIEPGLNRLPVRVQLTWPLPGLPVPQSRIGIMEILSDSLPGDPQPLGYLSPGQSLLTQQYNIHYHLRGLHRPPSKTFV